jgi:hypothetical protein
VDWDHGLSSPHDLEVMGSGGSVVWVPDLRQIGFDKKRIIVSKKRTRNVFDLTSLWKRTVLAKLDEQASEDLGHVGSPQARNPQFVFEPPVINPQLNESESDDEVKVIHRGSPQAPRTWRYGS